MKKPEEIKPLLDKSGAYAAIVYGSYLEGEDFNDIDVAVFADSEIYDVIGEAPEIFDIHRFSEMPLQVKHRVLRDGEIFFMEDRDRFYDDVIRFVKEYERFRPIYRDYLKGVKARG